MRLRRLAGSDHHIEDHNKVHRHEHAFTENLRRHGLLHEADVLPDSYGGKLNPRAVPVLLYSLPVILRALARRKITFGNALLHPHRRRFRGLHRLFDSIERRESRYELNLYVSGYDSGEPAEVAGSGPAMVATGASGLDTTHAPRRQGEDR